MAGRDLFASTTGDTDYGLFFTPRDMELFNDYNSELLEIIAQTKVKYWRVEKDYSDPNDIYGESDKKVTREPVEIFSWIMLDDPETQTGQYTTEIKRSIECYMHKDRLTEVNITPRIGDFVEYDNQFFEIISADVPTNVFSYQQAKIGVIVKCISIREDVFAGNRDIENEQIENDSANPY
tara:strand:+ start:6017 stop:6556 length:540 start_codon:yes stop_codon:yes gene_type:complete